MRGCKEEGGEGPLAIKRHLLLTWPRAPAVVPHCWPGLLAAMHGPASASSTPVDHCLAASPQPPCDGPPLLKQRLAVDLVLKGCHPLLHNRSVTVAAATPGLHHSYGCNRYSHSSSTLLRGLALKPSWVHGHAGRTVCMATSRPHSRKHLEVTSGGCIAVYVIKSYKIVCGLANVASGSAADGPAQHLPQDPCKAWHQARCGCCGPAAQDAKQLSPGCRVCMALGSQHKLKQLAPAHHRREARQAHCWHAREALEGALTC